MFHAIWDFDGLITQNRRRVIGADGKHHHSLILVDSPIPRGDHPEWNYGFYVYEDGFEGTVYLEKSWPSQGGPAIHNFRHFPEPAYAPDDLHFLLALTASHMLFPYQWYIVAIPLKIILFQETIEQNTMQVSTFPGVTVAPQKRTAENQAPHFVDHPYTLTHRFYEVSLGYDVCEVNYSLYQSPALWVNGSCWQREIDNHVFTSLHDCPIPVYGSPTKREKKV